MIRDPYEQQNRGEVIEWVYFKKMVPFSVGIRFHQRDPDGMVLNGSNPYVNIRKENVKEFLRANRIAFERGLIKEVDEPDVDFADNENQISEESARELVKNLFMLKKKLPMITSEAVLGMLYAEAKAQKRSQKIIDLIKDRIDDVTPPHLRGNDWSSEEQEDKDKE